MDEPRYPEIHVDLIGEDGNAFAIIGRVVRALHRAGLDREEVEAFKKEAKRGDYDHVLQTVRWWVDTD